MKPLGEQVLIEVLIEDRTAGGVLMPETAKEGAMIRRGKVLAMGPGQTEAGAAGFYTMPMPPISLGDVVLFDAYAAAKVDGSEQRVLVAARRILAVE